MPITKLRSVTATDFNDILQLNAAEVKWTSPLDMARLTQLHEYSDFHKVITVDGKVAAFLLVMSEQTAYDSPNYLWFENNCEDFMYVDRIVVSAEYAGHKLGSQLYQDLFETAKRRGLKYITCEYNLIPINKPSEFFHRRFGFQEVATQWLENNAKQVSLQVADVDAFMQDKS